MCCRATPTTVPPSGCARISRRMTIIITTMGMTTMTTIMARKNSKQRGLSRRRFMQSAAAMAASGTLLASAARAREHDSRGHDSECEGSRDLNLVNGRLLTLAELDTAAPGHAVYLSTTGAGGAVTNSLGRTFFQNHGVTVTINAAGAATLNSGQAFAALQAVQTDADRQRGTAEAVDFAASLGLTMVTDMGTQGAAVEYVDGYKYMMNLWRAGDLKIRLRSFLNSSFDTGFAAAQSVVTYGFPRHGDDVFRSNGVGERVNNNTTNPGYVDLVKFAASKGWMVTQHSLNLTEISFHIAAYQEAKKIAPIDKLRSTRTSSARSSRASSPTSRC